MIDFTQVVLGSSAMGKLQEYGTYNLPLALVQIADLPEVAGTPVEVITYKALAAGANCLVEDTSLEVEGEDVGVNVKWLLQELKTNPRYHGKRARWTVMLGLVYQQQLYVATAEVRGTLSSQFAQEPAFGFDSIFIPETTTETLTQLNRRGLKGHYSARKLAVDKMLAHQFLMTQAVDTIPAWTGAYQS